MKTSRWLVPVLAAGLVLAGCSKTDDTSTSTGGSPGGSAAPTTAASGGAYGDYGDKTTTTKAAATTGSTTAGGAVEIKTASSSVGQILVDEKGMTLYEFKKDTGTTSACTGDCTKAWPPLAGPAKAGSGVDASSLSTADRPDGIKQVTYKGHLLYHFAADSKAGDLGGQGLNNVWYVVGTDGNPIEKKAA